MDFVDSQVTGSMNEALSARTAAAMTTGWSENRSANVTQLVDLLEPAAVGVNVFADAVVALKVKAIAEMVITAAQIAIAVASAFVTFGASMAVQAGTIVVRKKAIDIATDVIVGEVIGQVAGMVVEPLTAALEPAITAMLDSPVVAGAAAEIGEYKADLDALEQIEGELSQNADAQEGLGQEYIAQVMALNISTAG